VVSLRFVVLVASKVMGLSASKAMGLVVAASKAMGLVVAASKAMGWSLDSKTMGSLATATKLMDSGSELMGSAIELVSLVTEAMDLVAIRIKMGLIGAKTEGEGVSVSKIFTATKIGVID